MKKIYLLSLLIMGIIASCQNEASLLENQQSKACMTITASLGDISDSRTTMETDGNGYKVVWSETDTLSVFVGSSTAHNKFKITEGVGETSATFVSVGEFSFGSNIEGSNSFANVGIYPYSSNTTVTKSNDDYVISTTIPTNQTYAENSFGENASPMIGVSNGFNFSFKNVASALAIPLKGTQTITHATLESSANKIAGSVKITAVANNNWIPTTDMSNGSSKVILSCGEGVKLNESTATKFFFVLAPGTYTAGDLTIKFYDNAGKYYAIHYTTKDQTFTRSIAKVFNERTFEVSGQAGIEEANNALASGAEDVTVTIAESDNTPTLELPETDSENPTNLTFDNTIPGDKTITIKASTESDNKEAKEVNLTVPQGTNGNFDIQLPNSTVSLNATNGTATYNNVIAETAENTLIVGQDVTINKLTVKKGNVRVHGTVNSIERHSANSGSVTIIVEDDAIIPDGLLAKDFIIIKTRKVTTAEDLVAAANSKDIDKIVLGADITMSNPLLIGSHLELDGGNHTLTYTGNDRAITVENDTPGIELTIQNLIVNCTATTCQRGINYNTNGILTLTNVTVKGNAITYAVNLPGSSVKVKVNMTNCKLTGLIALNIWGSNANITATDTEFISIDNNNTENYTAIYLNNNTQTCAENTTVEVNGGKIIAKDQDGNPSSAVINATLKGNVNISETTEVIGDINKPIAIITYENTDNYYACFSLQDALDEGGNIKVMDNITIDELVTINKETILDLNGKRVTSKAQKAFEVYANANIKNGTIEAVQRCVDTRMNVNLTLDNLTLIADNYSSYGNPQPLTIGGSNDGTVVTMNKVKSSAKSGYCIITFVKTDLTATNSSFEGYNVLYVKPGSEESSFKFISSNLYGSLGNNDVEGNSFSTIAVRANNVTVNVDASSTVTAEGNHYCAISLGGDYQGEESVTGAEVIVAGTINGNIFNEPLNGNIVKVPSTYVSKLQEEGFAASEAVENGLVTIISKVVF